MTKFLVAAAMVTLIATPALPHDVTRDMEKVRLLAGDARDAYVDTAIILYFKDRDCTVTPENAGADNEPMKYLPAGMQLDKITAAELIAGELDHADDHGSNAAGFSKATAGLEETFRKRWRLYFEVGVIEKSKDGNSLIMKRCK